MDVDRPVLVTGAAGFLGAHLCLRLLEHGYRVLGVDDLSRGRLERLEEARARHAGRFQFDRLDVRRGGLRALAQRHRPGIVYHLAAQTSATRDEDPHRHLDVNVRGALEAATAAADVGARLVQVGSAEELDGPDGPEGDGGHGSDAGPVDETAHPRPRSAYAASLQSARAFAHAQARSHGLDHVSLVLPAVYGPGQDDVGEGGIVLELLAAMLTDRPCPLPDEERTLDLLYVDDAVHALVLAADRGAGRRLLVGTGRETSLGQLFSALAAVTGYGHAPVPAPSGGRHAPPRMALSVGRAAQQLGWKPWTPLEEGLAATIAWADERRGA